MKRKSNTEQITKRVVIRASKAGVKKAAKNTMNVMGYNVVAKDGWVVKEFKNGEIERIAPIHTATKTLNNTTKVSLAK